MSNCGIGFSDVHGISGGGSVVVGCARSPGYPCVEAYCLETTNGIESLDTFGPIIQSTWGIGTAYGGSVIVGDGR